MTDAERVYEIINELRKYTTIILKLKILEEHKEDAELIQFFKLALDKSIIYNVKKLPVRTVTQSHAKYESMTDVYMILHSLQQFKGNKAKRLIEDFQENSTDAVYEVFSCIIAKNPRCGVSSALVNRIWKDLIHDDIKLCKAMSYSEKNFSRITYPAIVQRKCDGARCLAFVYPSENKVEFFSSNNKRYIGLEKYLADEALQYDVEKVPYILDGELLVRSPQGNILKRKDGNGILNKISLGTATDDEMSRVDMVIWDMILLDDYRENKSSVPYDYVMTGLLVENEVEPKKHIYPVETRYANNKDEVIAIFHEMLARGEEGVIVKNKNMHWENKRSRDAVKMKLAVEVTLKIVDIFEGTGKYAGKLGGFVCESSDGIIKVRVGSGFDDDDRTTYNNTSVIGQCVEIAFNDIVQNADGTQSLFLPIFKNMRTDKTEADNYDTIKSVFSMSQSLE